MGFFALAFAVNPAGEKAEALVALASPFSLVFAYGIGILPAVAAGLVYAALALAAISLKPRLVVNWSAGTFTGATSGLLIVATGSALASGPALPLSYVACGALAGAASGMLAGWLFPVGRNPGLSSHSAA